MLDNILASKLYRPGSVAYVSRSGGMSNELNNIISRTTDGVYEGVAIGGDRYKNLIADHLLENFFIKKKMHKSILESILKKKILVPEMSAYVSLCPDIQARPSWTTSYVIRTLQELR